MGFDYQRRNLKLIYFSRQNLKIINSTDDRSQEILRYDLTDTAGVLENKVLSMFHGLDE